MAEVNPKEDAKMSHKAKVYLLTLEGNWNDCGTGFAEIVKETINDKEAEFLQVTRLDPTQISQEIPAVTLKKLVGNKDDKKYILHRPILKLSKAEKHSETIIKWIDEDSGEEVAISFLNKGTTEEIWKIIQESDKTQ